MSPRIYLDHNATTPIDATVLDVYITELKKTFGNPSSTHGYGQEARNKLLKARQTIAAYLGVNPLEIVFHSGATEGINTLMRGTTSGHIITSSVEHSCVYATAKTLAAKGQPVTFLNPGLLGAITAAQLINALTPETTLIVLMAVNNETGVKTDLNAIAAIAEKANIPLFIDGVAWLGKEQFSIPNGVSAMCFSGHKIHAPKGIGFSFVRKKAPYTPLISGGDQEANRRGGTENVPAILALAEAIKQLKHALPAASSYMQSLRDRFEHELMAALKIVSINGQGPRICNTSNLSFEGVDGESLLMQLDMEGVAVSHGSACASGTVEPSRVLLNMGMDAKRARSSIRISLSRFTTEAEIDRAIEVICKVVKRLRS